MRGSQFRLFPVGDEDIAVHPLSSSPLRALISLSLVFSMAANARSFASYPTGRWTAEVDCGPANSLLSPRGGHATQYGPSACRVINPLVLYFSLTLIKPPTNKICCKQIKWLTTLYVRFYLGLQYMCGISPPRVFPFALPIGVALPIAIPTGVTLSNCHFHRRHTHFPFALSVKAHPSLAPCKQPTPPDCLVLPPLSTSNQRKS